MKSTTFKILILAIICLETKGLTQKWVAEATSRGRGTDNVFRGLHLGITTMFVLFIGKEELFTLVGMSMCTVTE